MIIYAKDGVNPDDYCYDTGLDFGVHFGQEMLQAVLRNPAGFQRKPTNAKTDNKREFMRIVGPRHARIAFDRQAKLKDAYSGQTNINFRQVYMPEPYVDEFRAATPDWILSLCDGEPKPALQWNEGGDFLPPHRGHPRTSSFFMLLQGQDQETSWYRKTEDFEDIPAYGLADIDKLELIVTAVMKPFRWYVFNHAQWHGVTKYAPDQKRVNIGWDFFSLSAQDLVKATKEHKNG